MHLYFKFKFFSSITQVLLKHEHFYKCLSDISCSFRCDFTIISWNLTFPDQRGKGRRTWWGKVQVILSNSSSLVSPWVQLSSGSELWMHVCVQGWETGPGLVFRPHLGKKTATLRCSDWSLSADFKIRVWSEEFCSAQFTSSSQPTLYFCTGLTEGWWKPTFRHGWL